MSQSDLLKHKRISTLLRVDTQPPVFNSQTLLDFKQFQLVNTITNSKQLYNQSVNDNRTNVFNMELNVSGCETFIDCSGTDQRPNRVLNYFDGTPQVSPVPLNWRVINDLKYVKDQCILCRPKSPN